MKKQTAGRDNLGEFAPKTKEEHGGFFGMGEPNVNFAQ